MSWTAPAMVAALKTAIGARAGITALSPAVTVRTVWLPPDATPTDVVMLFGANDTNRPAAVGGSRYEETVIISGEIRLIRAGASETVAAAARTRMADILGEIDSQLRAAPPSVGDQTISALITNRDYKQFADRAETTAVTVTLATFDIVYKSRTS